MTDSLLFVDDQTALLEAMREFFTARGYAVDCATELEEAQALIDCREYALAVCDVALQGSRDAEGLEVVSHIRSMSPHTRIVILTAGHLSSIQERARHWRVDRFLSKPHPLPSLAALIEQLLSARDAADVDAP